MGVGPQVGARILEKELKFSLEPILLDTLIGMNVSTSLSCSQTVSSIRASEARKARSQSIRCWVFASTLAAPPPEKNLCARIV